MAPPNKVESKQEVSLLSHLEPEQLQCYDHIRSLVEEKDHYSEFTKEKRFIRCIIEVSDPSDAAEFLTRRTFRFGILPADRDAAVSNIESELKAKLEEGKLTEEDRTKAMKSLKQVAEVNDSLLVLKIFKDHAHPLDVVMALKDKADILIHMALCPAHPAVIREKAELVLKTRLIYEVLLKEDISKARKRLNSDDLAPDMVAGILFSVATDTQYDISVRENATSLLFLRKDKLSKNDIDAFLAAFQMGEMDGVGSFPLLLSTFELPGDKMVSHIVNSVMRVAVSYQILFKQYVNYSKDVGLYKKGLLPESPRQPVLADRLEPLEKYTRNLAVCLRLVDPEGKQGMALIERLFKNGDEHIRSAITKAVTLLFPQEAFQWLKRVASDEDELASVKNEALESLAFLASMGQLDVEQMKWIFEYARASLKGAAKLTPSLLAAFEDLLVPSLKEEVFDIMSGLISAKGTDVVTKIGAIVLMGNAGPEDEKAVAFLLETATTTSNDGIFMAAIKAMGIIGRKLDRGEFYRLISATRNRPIFHSKKTIEQRYAAVRYLNEIRPDGAEKLSFLTEGGPEFMHTAIDDRERAGFGSREVTLMDVQQNGRTIQYADASRKDYAGMAYMAVKQTHNAYALISPEMQKEPTIRLLVIQEVQKLAASPWPEWALPDKTIRSEEDFVLAAVEVNVKLLKLADEKLLTDPNFLSKALSTNFNVVSMLDDRSSANVWRFLINQLHENGRSFPPELEESYTKFAEVLSKKYGIDVRRYRHISDVHETFRGHRASS